MKSVQPQMLNLNGQPAITDEIPGDILYNNILQYLGERKIYDISKQVQYSIYYTLEECKNIDPLGIINAMQLLLSLADITPYLEHSNKHINFQKSAIYHCTKESVTTNFSWNFTVYTLDEISNRCIKGEEIIMQALLEPIFDEDSHLLHALRLLQAIRKIATESYNEYKKDLYRSKIIA